MAYLGQVPNWQVHSTGCLGRAKNIHRSLTIFVNKEKICQNNDAESQNLQTFGLPEKFRSWHKRKESEK